MPCCKHISFSKWIPPFQKQISKSADSWSQYLVFFVVIMEDAIPDYKWRRILVKYFIHRGKKVVKHWMEIYASSYQIIRYHDQFTWAKMWNFYFAVEAFFKENFFFSLSFFFPQFPLLIHLLLMKRKQNITKWKKSSILGQESHSCKVENNFFKLFCWCVFWPVK